MFKRLRCNHAFDLTSIGKWYPTFETSNGLADEDERILKLECWQCGKKKNVTQTMVRGEIISHLDIINHA